MTADATITTSWARHEIERRLGLIGCKATGVSITARTRGWSLDMGYAGRDEQGHAADLRLRVAVDDGTDEQTMDARIAKALRSQERRAAAARWLPPVTAGERMPLSHLEVSMPYARRLRIDHGDQAQQALRQAIVARLAERGVRAHRSAVPNQPSFSGHRIDHREEIGPGVHLRGGHLVIASTTLPEQLAIALPGRSVTALCSHPILGDDDIVAAIEMTNTGTTHGKRTVTVKLEPNWLRADQI